MITTRDRAADLRRTLDVLWHLNPPPHEVLITADGCTDETVLMVKAEKRKAESGRREAEDGRWQMAEENGKTNGLNIRLFVNPVGLGSVASRDRMMREARGDLVLALDDDSYPEQSNCLETLSSFFSRQPDLAIATFPQRTDEYPETLTTTDFGAERAIRSFPNSGACLRVSTYRSLAGFEPMFFHMYEEPDYALQCVAAGWEVRLVPSITIRHHWTPNQRSEIRNHHRHARNEFWSTLMRCPLPQMPLLLLYRIFAQARFAAKRGWLLREPHWWLDGIRGIPQALRRRSPVTWAGYKKWLTLKN